MVLIDSLNKRIKFLEEVIDKCDLKGIDVSAHQGIVNWEKVKNSNDAGKEHLLERINSRHGTHAIDAAAELGIGTKEYELINID